MLLLIGLVSGAGAQSATTITTVAGKFTICQPPLLPCPAGAAPLTEIHMAGNDDGLGLTEATFRVPLGMAIDANGSVIVCDSTTVVEPFTGIVRTMSPILGSSPTSTRGTLLYTVGPSPSLPIPGTPSVTLPGTNGIVDIAVTAVATAVTGAAGNWVIADRGNHQIRIYDPLGVLVAAFGVEAVAGDTDDPPGPATFNTPSGVALDDAGNIYVADQTNHRIRRIDAATGEVTTVAGSASPHQFSLECTAGCPAGLLGGFADGTLATAQFKCPTGITRGASDAELFVADSCNHRIRKIDLAAGMVTTVAGSVAGFMDGAGAAARFNAPAHIDRDPAGNLYVADALNRKIRRITSSGLVSTIGRNETVTTDAFDLLNSEVPGVTTPPFADHFDLPFGIVVGTLGAAGVPVDDDVLFASDIGTSPVRGKRIREIVRMP